MGLYIINFAKNMEIILVCNITNVLYRVVTIK